MHPTFNPTPLEPNMRVVLSTDEAREGVTGHGVRYVLGFGLAAVVAAFVVLFVTGIA